MKKVNLTIPQPCHENWNQMTATEQGRFCQSCQKQVIDFSAMSDQQLVAFFKQPTGNVCGRFLQDQLDRDLPVPKKRIPWLRYFFQFTLPAFLISLKAVGQKEVRLGRVAINKSIVSKPIDSEKPLTVPPPVITGKVSDERGNAIPFASVVIKGTNKGVMCDSDGKFEMPLLQPLPFTIVISSVGFEAKEYKVQNTVENEVVLVTMQVVTAGMVVVRHSNKKTNKTIPLISNLRRDTAFSQFSIYPNPARSNGNITIDCKKSDKGEYVLQLTASDGRAVCVKSIELEHKGGLLRTDLPTLIPGQYIVTLTHKKSGKTYSEKIQVL